MLSLERLAVIPPEHLSATFGSDGLLGYFEEDRDWSIVAVAFPEEWSAFVVEKLREADLIDVAPRLFEALILPRIENSRGRSGASRRRAVGIA